MIRIGLHLTTKQDEKLRKLSAESGLTVSEIIRRALDWYLSEKKEKS